LPPAAARMESSWVVVSPARGIRLRLLRGRRWSALSAQLFPAPTSDPGSAITSAQASIVHDETPVVFGLSDNQGLSPAAHRLHLPLRSVIDPAGASVEDVAGARFIAGQLLGCARRGR
jgi:hypothetical protein